MTKRVVVIGNTAVDHVFRLPRPLATDAKIDAASYVPHAGGQASNAALALAGLGRAVSFVGVFGDDGGAALCRAALFDAGVDLASSPTLRGCPHHVAVVLVAGATRSIVMHRDPRLEIGPVAIDLADCAAVYSDGHHEAPTREVAARAAAAGVPVVADCEVIPSDVARFLALTDHLVAPAASIRALAGADDLPTALRALRRRGPRAVVATCGADGAIGVDGSDELVAVAAVACAVVDTTGAGDAFHAGYVDALVRGDVLASRLAHAAWVAAAKCEVPGPTIGPAALRSFRASARP